MTVRIICTTLVLLVVTAQIGSVFSDGNFAASVASSSSGPQGGHVFAATYPGPDGKPLVQGTSWPGPDGNFDVNNRFGPAAASASANSGKAGVPGVKPIRPNPAAGSGDKSIGSGVKVQSSPNSVSVSSSSSANSGVNSIGIRGSFGDGDDNVSVQVNGQNVNGPKGSGGASAAAYPAYSGPGYYDNSFGSANSFSGAGAGAGGPGAQYPIDAMNAVEFFNQYFAAMRAQQEAFQRQLQAMFQQQNANPYIHAPMNYGAGFGNTGGFPPYAAGGAPYGQPFYSGNAGASASASAGASVGPNGGFQSAQISPASPGIETRFGDAIPPPSGSSFGVFSSSSSSSRIGPDGKPVVQKEATIGVNDNGKISVHTVHDP